MKDETIKRKDPKELLASEENLLEFDTANYMMQLKDQLACNVINNIPHNLYDKTPQEIARKVWSIVNAIMDERSYFKPIY